ncbi:MAG: MBL fold metallo-hydrolase [Patescibacteria group bacterium]|jgi:L-ascorbate metabolism protein UlaG (beta-lactamase superfamily)|nr:MBL fold metallo-hydrolase [Patescibacteria group bacterium]
MIINWFGQSCFKIQGDKSVLITDPLAKDCGLKLPRLSADVVSFNSPQTDSLADIKGIAEPQAFIVSQPGEYEIKNIIIQGINAPSSETEKSENHANIIYRFEIDGIKIAHLGNLNHSLINGEVEKLEGLDILMIPVGGGFGLNARQATETISQLEPRIVIPMSYQIPGLKLKSKIDGIEVFCKEIGVCPKEEIAKFKITKKDLPQNDLQVVILQP